MATTSVTMDLCSIPLARNPDGGPPNFVDPPSLGHLSYGISSTMITIGFLFVGIRLFAVLKKEGKLRLDDYCCIIALVLNTGYCVMVMFANANTRHAWDTPVCALDTRFLKSLAALTITYGPAAFFAKASVCTLYLRIFGVIPWLRYSIWTCLFILGCLYTAMVPVWAVYMFPHGNEHWDVQMALKANKMRNLAFFIGVVNLLADLFMLVVPVPVVLGLNMSLRKRIGVIAVFMTGVAVAILAAMSNYYRAQLFYFQNTRSGGDVTWTAALTVLMYVIEGQVTIIVSCTPGVVSAWRDVFRNAPVFTAVRSFFTHSHTALSRSSASQPQRKTVSRSTRHSDEADLAPKHGFEFELYEKDAERERGRESRITKTTNLHQWTV